MVKTLLKLAKLSYFSFLFFICVFLFIKPGHTAELSSGEWFVRLIAQAPSEQLKDQGNALGYLNNSNDGYDRHDLKELPPFGSPYLTIVFPHTDWTENAGDYSSDFHKRKYWRLGDEWDFVVKSDTPRRITISWEGYDGIRLLWRMRLIDMETGRIIRAVKHNQLQTYTFNMVDTTHRFKWVYLARPAS